MRRPGFAAALLGGGVLVLLAVFALVPLGLVVRMASGGNALAELSAPGTREAALHSIALGLLVCAVAVPAGTFWALVLERTDALAEAGQRRAQAILALPLSIPPYLLGMAWLLLGNGRTGLLNRFGAVVDLYGLDGMVLVLATSTYPFALLAVRAALVRADPSLEEAARIAGAGPWRVARDVTLPLARPAIAGATGLIFVFTEAAFGVPYLFGSTGDSAYRVLTTRIYQDVTLGGEAALQRAAISALALLALSVAVQAGMSAIARRRSAVQVGGKVARPSRIALGRMRGPIRATLFVFAAAFIALPIATIAWTSFVATFAEPGRLSTQHWTSVLNRSETVRAFTHAAVLAVAAGIIVALVGASIARWARAFGPFGKALAALSTMPYAVPGTVLAIGFLLAFSREVRVIVLERATFALNLSGTLGLLLAAYAVKYLAFGVRGIDAALAQIHPALEEAARVFGAKPLRSFRDVVLPLVAPAATAAFILVALAALSELTMSVLLFGAGTETTGTLLFELQSYADPPEGAVVATAIVLVAIAGDLGARALARRSLDQEPT